ncbi:MAG: hypothetical protein GXO50_08230 [Chlorobi bacterium]|nr:hypothetical protein [Chlorobiota bacterium]
MDKNPKPSKAREILWIAVAIMSLSAGISKTIRFSLSESWYFFIFVIIAAGMYALRRNLRKKYENDINEKN